ncbi:MAG: hypothetical protein FJ098_15570, partial [Deltaproteobacteria bacterium]|nr:hypothetical protein [Deltaproteobacteria bacterium]
MTTTMRRNLFISLLLAFVVAGCGGSGQTTTTPGQDTGGDTVSDGRSEDLVLDGAPEDGPGPDGVEDIKHPGDGAEDGVLPDVPGDHVLPPDATGDGGPQGPCKNHDDCEGGYCIEFPPGSDEKICAETCLEECPEGLECRWVYLPGGEPVSVCLPPVNVLCKLCNTTVDCLYEGTECVKGDLPFGYCATPCDLDAPDCPQGYACQAGIGGIQFGSPQCVPTEGACCVAGGWLDCDDSNPCTLDACHPTLGCQHEPQEGECSGPVPCTEYVCVGGECVGWPVSDDMTWDGVDDDCDGQTDED